MTNYTDLFLGQNASAADAPDVQVLQALGELIRQAGQANLAAFNSVVVGEDAKLLGVRDEVLQQALADNDELYAIAQFTSQPDQAQSTSKSQLTQLQQAYLTLGAAMDTYAVTSVLMAKYYSLQANVDEDGSITGYGLLTPLTNMLQLGQTDAYNALSSTKELSLPALYAATNGDAYRDTGDQSDKLTALFDYWSSGIFSRL